VLLVQECPSIDQLRRVRLGPMRSCVLEQRYVWLPRNSAGLAAVVHALELKTHSCAAFCHLHCWLCVFAGVGLPAGQQCQPECFPCHLRQLEGVC
jgi:hypothetical protein